MADEVHVPWPPLGDGDGHEARHATGQPVGHAIGVFRGRRVSKDVGAGAQVAPEAPAQENGLGAGHVEAMDKDDCGGHRLTRRKAIAYRLAQGG